MSLKERAKQLQSDIPAVYIALKDKETPLVAKILAGITVIYALSPIDLIPDFIPILGYLDDILLLPVLIPFTLKCIPATVWERSKKESEAMWTDGKPKKWYYALPIVAIWLIIVLLIVKTIWL